MYFLPEPPSLSGVRCRSPATDLETFGFFMREKTSDLKYRSVEVSWFCKLYTYSLVLVSSVVY